MAELTAGITTTTPAFRPPWRRILVGLFLIGSFAATTAILLFVITTERLQSAISAPNLATLKISTGWIRRDVTEVEHYWTVMNTITARKDAAQEMLFNTQIDNEGTRAAMITSANAIRNYININDTLYIKPPLKIHHLAELASTAPSNPNTTVPVGDAANAANPAPTPALAVAADLRAAVDDYFDGYYATLGNSSADMDARKSLDTFKTETYRRLEAYFAARTQYDADASKVTVLKAQIDALDEEAKKVDATIAPTGSALANDDYWNLVEDFSSFKALAGEWAYSAVLLPRMMLILVLSIFMGILGSLIYISQDYLKNPDGRGFWDILFRIGLGAGVAFALFFFAAAGMLALSQNPNGSQGEMSPYLISFLGITGGYLSDRVTQWMREVGENAFRIKSDGPPARWAVNLSDALKTNNLEAASLASAISVPPADVDAWIALSKPTPGEMQGLVAAYLREHPSKLFTDIAPG
jgi:hypothetical protein